MTICVIGAGAAGLSAARHLGAASIPFEVLERERDVGGIWDASLLHGPVYHSAHLISSKPLTQFPDFPMPREYPDYPDHAQALASGDVRWTYYLAHVYRLEGQSARAASLFENVLRTQPDDVAFPTDCQSGVPWIR